MPIATTANARPNTTKITNSSMIPSENIFLPLSESHRYRTNLPTQDIARQTATILEFDAPQPIFQRDPCLQLSRIRRPFEMLSFALDTWVA